MPAPAADAFLPWRATLMAVPPERRTSSQKNLIGDLERADFIKDRLSTSLIPSLDDPDTQKILLRAVESYLLGPFEVSAINSPWTPL